MQDCSFRSIARTVVALAFTLAPLAALAQEVPRNDRSPVLAPATRTTDDPRRIPMRPLAPGKAIVLRNARLFDAVAAKVRPATIVILGNRIEAVLPGDAAGGWPDGAEMIDLAGKTVLPGLIDMHVHLTYPDGTTPVDQQANDGMGVLLGTRNLRWMLEAGITSVRDLNGVGEAPYILADASARGMIPAPRVFTAGHLITGTGGHATERPITPTHGPAFAWERDGADAWRAAVRETFKRGASVIKVASHFAPDEIAAAVDEAHRLGLKVTCDCETIYTKMAVDAGIDMIEHPLPRTDATIAAMAKRGTASVPTLQVYQAVIDRAGGFWGSTSRRSTMTAQGDFDQFKKMKAAGIVMGVGTDTIGEANRLVPNTYIAELKWFVKGGYSIPQALQAATLVNARLLDMGDKLGSVDPGKLADMVVVDGRPDEDIEALRGVDLVIKDGVVLVRGGQLVVPRHVPAPLAKPSPPDDVR